MKSKIESIILDLGNTVFYIDFDLTFQYWGKVSGMDWQQLKERFQFDEQHTLFEKGILTEEEFVEHIGGLMGFDLSLEDFIIGWNEIYLENLDGIEDFMKSASQKYRLLALSNTNFTHERVWADKYKDLFEYFELAFVSHRMMAVKPDAEIYQQVLDYLQMDADKTVFLDDKLENIEGARKMGMNGIYVQSPKQMYAELRELGVEW